MSARLVLVEVGMQSILQRFRSDYRRFAQIRYVASRGPRLILKDVKASSSRRMYTSCCRDHNAGMPKRLYLLQNLQTHVLSQERCFWGVDVAFNKVDEERVRLAGPDRACAEWVLRNGGSIKWTSSGHHLKDYNLLPSTDFQSYNLEEIDLSATDVINMGFEHLKDLKHLRKIKVHGVGTISDEALENLQYVKETLEVLEVSQCPMITEKGLKHLQVLKKLKLLLVYDLIEARNFESVVSDLKKSMPWCKIDTAALKPTSPSEKAES